jgi:prevent-host-death family protein
MAKSYSVYEAKTHFSEVLRNVKRGGEVVVTERGVPIAKVSPLKNPSTLEERVQYLTTSGVILTRRLPGPMPRGVKRAGALKRFLEERE